MNKDKERQFYALLNLIWVILNTLFVIWIINFGNKLLRII